uniref:Uncharacterized protein n=1 Tax=Glossina pallidipes TaxID=7398 RepID=A0A1B0AH33_GLOPL
MVLVSLVKVVIIVIVYEMEHSSVEERTRRSSIYEEYWLAEYRDKHGQKYLLAKDLIVEHGNALQARFNITSMEMVTSTSAARTPEHFIPIEKDQFCESSGAFIERSPHCQAALPAAISILLSGFMVSSQLYVDSTQHGIYDF